MKQNYLNKSSSRSVAQANFRSWERATVVVLALFISSFAMGQSRTVSGTVTDDTGASLPGVNIQEKGTTNGTVSDADGKYQIALSGENATLIFSFVGMVTQEVTVGSQDVVNVQLLPDATALSEVVVVGYGTQEAKDVTGAVKSVKADQFNRGVINSTEQLLQGKVAGVNITSRTGEPGSPFTISIRGQGSIRSGVNPLFVVDGLPLENLSGYLNPQDIESMDVLKDASATAIYGARGANGVVIITTKKGKSGRSGLTYATSVGISNLSKKMPIFSADEFRKQVVAVGGTLTDLNGATDWQDEITRTAYTKNHNITLSGGSDNLSYYASLGVQDQDGILKKNNWKRYSGRINVTQKMLDSRLKIDLNLNASNINNTRPDIGGLLGTALGINPTYPARDNNGKPTVFPDVVNPLTMIDWFDDFTNTTRVISSITPSFEIIKGLVYKMNFGIDYADYDRDIQYRPSTTPFQAGDLDSYFGKSSNKLIENYVTYTLERGEHSGSVLGGYSYQRFFYHSRHWSIDKFVDNGLEPRYTPGLGTELDLIDNRPEGGALINELQSFFGRANYSFRNRYLVTATLRVDGSTKFGGNNKYGKFPSFSLGWRVNEEGFMQGLPFSNLKLRAGWGQTGNQEFPAKQTQARTLTTTGNYSTYPLVDAATAYVPGIIAARLPNPNLQWEVSTQTNIGVDFGLLSDKLTGTIDYFNKISSNVLLDLTPSDPIVAVNSYYTNVDKMRIFNKGLELSLNYQFGTSGSLKYNIGGNITFIDNEVKDSPYTIITTGSASGSGLTSATINGILNGEPIGTYYMKEFIGIGSNGLNAFKDVNNDQQDTDKDRIAVGSALPKKIYNFYGSINFKGFDLSVNFNGISGNKIYNNTANNLFYKARLAKSLNSTSIATEYPNESTTNSAAVSTRYLEDGSFLRLNNATLGYNFNMQTLHIDKWVRSIRAYLTGQNLFVITKYTGFDPEVNTDHTVNSITSYGIDFMGYPKARTFMFGLDVSF